MRDEFCLRLNKGRTQLFNLPVILGFAFTALGCAVNRVVPASDSLVVDKGASYYLPQLAAVASVPVEMTTTTRADYAFYALPLLRIHASTAKVSDIKYQIGDECSLEFAGVRDPAQKYLAIYPKGIFKTFNQNLTLNQEGVLTKGEATIEDKTVDFVVSTLSGAANVAGASINPAGEGDRSFFPADRGGLDELADHLNEIDGKPNGNLTAKVLAFGLTIMLSSDPNSRLSNLEKAEERIAPLDEKIKNASATEKAALEEQRKTAIAEAGQVQSHLKPWLEFVERRPKAFADLKSATLAYKELDEINKRRLAASTADDYQKFKDAHSTLLSKFIQKTTKKTTIVQLRWIPGSRPSQRTSGQIAESKAILTLNSITGLTSATIPLSQLPSDLRRSGKGGKTSTVSLLCSSTIPVETAQWAGLLKDGKSHGWHYRIPAASILRLNVDGMTKIRREVPVAQHGCIAFMPATAFSEKVTSSITLDPLTGGLINSVHGGEASDPGMMTTLGDSIAGVTDARDARKAVKSAEEDELNILKRKKEILQLKKDISELENQ